MNKSICISHAPSYKSSEESKPQSIRDHQNTDGKTFIITNIIYTQLRRYKYAWILTGYGGKLAAVY